MSIESRLTALQLKVEEIFTTVAKNGKDIGNSLNGGTKQWDKKTGQLDLFSVKDAPPPLLSPHAEIRTLELWRCVMAECLGTLFLVFLICGACIPWTGHFPPFLTIAFATALAYGALAYRVFPGSHLNPAFTIALAAVKRVSGLRFLLFLVAQAGGAIAGSAILYGLTVPGYQGILGGTSVASHVNPWQACGLEFILCLMMTLTFLLDPTDCFSTTAVLLVANLVALPCTGAGLNPVRSLGPAFVMNKWPNHWVFWLGPLAVSVTAAYLHAFILHRRRKSNKLRENPSDGDSLDIPATEMPNANGIPETEMDDSNYMNYDINNHQTYDTLTSQLIEPAPQYNQCEVRLETFNQAFKSHALMLNDDRNRQSPIECDVCKKSFTLIQHLRIHMHIHNDEKKFQCELCPEQFVLETDLTNHMKQHSDNYKPFKCKICGQAYSHERNLKVHQQVHINNVMFKCDQCDKEFNQMFSLKIHMNVHNNKPYKCSLCEKTFSQSSNLKNHLNVHNGHRPHKCDVCGKGFNQISSLRSHKYGHTGDKPHKCTVCDKTYTQSSSLKVHMNIHNGFKPYKCHICLKEFTDPSNFRKHKATTHSV